MRLLRYFRIEFVLIAVVAVALAWYHSFAPKTFSGDDLWNYLDLRAGIYASNLHQIFFDTYMIKHRPVFAAAWNVVGRLSRGDYSVFVVVILGLHALNIVLFYVLALATTGGRRVIAILVTIPFAASRFSIYQTTQATGLIEALALTFFLLSLLALLGTLSPGARSKNVYAFLTLVLTVLACWTHERYLSIALVYAAGLFVALRPSEGRPGSARWIFAGLAALIPVVNFLEKTVLLKMPFFIGTSHTTVAFRAELVVEHLTQALLSIFGFNYGPDHVSGGSISWAAPRYVIVSAVIFTVVLPVVILAGGSRTLKDADRTKLLLPLILVSLIVALLIPPIMTTRLDQRWLLAPFGMLLLLAGWGVATLRAKRPRAIALAAMAVAVVCSVLVDRYFSQFYYRYWFFMGNVVAQTLRDQLQPDRSPSSSPVFVIMASGHCAHSLLGGRFFAMYGGIPRELRCFDAVEDVRRQGLPADARLFRDFSLRRGLVEITDSYRSRFPAGQTYRSLLDDLPAAIVAGPNIAETPTGKAVYAANWIDDLGPGPSLMLIGKQSITFRGLVLPESAALSFAAGMALYALGAMTLKIEIKAAQQDTALCSLSRVFVPPKPGENVRYRRDVIDLAPHAGKQVDITFTSQSVGEEGRAHWLSIFNPALIEMNAGDAARGVVLCR